MTMWEKSYTADLKQVDFLKDELPNETEDYTNMNNHVRLESRLVHIHSLARRIDEIRTKYGKELAKDEVSR